VEAKGPRLAREVLPSVVGPILLATRKTRRR